MAATELATKTWKFQPYDQNSIRKIRNILAQELDEILKTKGVAQIDGMNDDLVNELYQEAKKFPKRVGRYREDSYYQEIFSFLPNSQISDSIYIPPKTRPVNLLRKIKRRFSYTAEIVAEALTSLYEEVGKPEDLFLLRYRKGPNLYPTVNKRRRRKIILGAHTDHNYFMLAAKSSHKGLEGYVQEQWISLQPEEGNFLIMPCTRLETISDEKIKALTHRVMTPQPENSIRYALMYY